MGAGGGAQREEGSHFGAKPSSYFEIPLCASPNSLAQYLFICICVWVAGWIWLSVGASEILFTPGF